MKKQNDTKNVQMATPAKPKRVKKEHTFFLYADDKGFICESEGIPTIGGETPLKFTERKMAIYAIKFFKQIKLANEIALFAKIA